MRQHIDHTGKCLELCFESWLGMGVGMGVDIEDDCLEAIGCVDSVWYFRPCFDTKDAAQRSH